MEMLFDGLYNLFIFFCYCLNAASYLAVIYVYLNRKTIKLCYSNKKPTWIDFAIICLSPITFTIFLYLHHHEYTS